MIVGMFYNFIQLTYVDDGSSSNGWTATVDFFDAAFGRKEGVSTEGQLRTRYAVHEADVNSYESAAVVAARNILLDLETLGIIRQEDCTLFVANRENEELGKPNTISYKDIPAKEIVALRQFALENGFGFFGVD